MQNKTIRNQIFRPFMLALLLVMFVQPGYTAGKGGKTMKFGSRDSGSGQYNPEVMVQLIENLGYDSVPIHDPNVGRPVQVAKIYEKYHMLFQAQDNENIQVAVTIWMKGDKTSVQLYDTGKEKLDEDGLQHYQRLKENLVANFGDSKFTEHD